MVFWNKTVSMQYKYTELQPQYSLWTKWQSDGRMKPHAGEEVWGRNGAREPTQKKKLVFWCFFGLETFFNMSKILTIPYKKKKKKKKKFGSALTLLT